MILFAALISPSTLILDIYGFRIREFSIQYLGCQSEPAIENYGLIIMGQARIFNSLMVLFVFLFLTQETLEKVARGYIYAPVQIVQAVLPSMLKQKSGCIINITSGAGEKDPPIPASRGGWGYAYGAGKAAVSRLSGIICREHGHEGIRAFTVNPGVVNTETLRAAIGDQGIKGLQQSLAEPVEIADTLLWIADNAEADTMQYSTIQAQKLAHNLKQKK